MAGIVRSFSLLEREMPRTRTVMRRIREVLRLKFDLGLSDSEVARGAGVARSTVQDHLRRIATSGMKPDELQALDDAALDERLFGPRDRRDTSRPLPDWAEIERQLRGRAVTLRLLWKEYEEANGKAYKYSQFVAHFRAWQQASRPPVMHQVHRAGEEMEVDYAGMTLTVYDQGVTREAQIFVACLPCSQLIYAEASWSQGTEDWLGAHVRALTFIGGCPEKLVPDNLKSGVTEASYYDPVLNRSYHELARHYGIAIVPARVRRPRDKPSVEGAVNQVERWVLAALRNRRLFSLDEANTAIAERLEFVNNRPFSPPREGSRRSLFEEIERTALKPLPAEPFAIGRWLTVRANIDYHIDADRHFYSVPHPLVHKRLDVFLTATAVSVFFDGKRVASHVRSFLPGKYTTLPEHMPPAHLAVAQRTPDRLRQQAAKLGRVIGVYVDRLLTAREHPEQGMRACLGIFRMADTYGAARVTLACERALAAGALSSRYVEQLLKADQRQPFLDQQPDEGLGVHSNVRGSSYYN
jgi:transposase